MIESFHFLRPLWLLALLPALALVPLVRRREDPRRPWKGVIEPHLLDALVVGEASGFRLRPVHGTATVLALAALAAAGPTWEREPPPFAEERAPLVIVIDASRSMDAIDVAPTRLERAKHKLRDLLGERAGARTALVAYAGSAHVVLPLTDDTDALETYGTALESALMPVAGDDPLAALELASEILADESAAGSILFLTDGIAAEQAAAFAAHPALERNALLVLAVGTSEGGPIRVGEGRYATDASGAREIARLDVAGLEALADATGAFVASTTTDDRDVARVLRNVQSHLESATAERAEGRWRDRAHALAWPVALLVALAFRRGWTVRL